MGTDRNWIQKVTLNGVGPFAGGQAFEFTKGLNVIVGPKGSRGGEKTRLLRDIAGAWTGNHLADDGMERDFTVRLETEYGEATLTDSGDGWGRSRTWSRPEGWDAGQALLLDDIESATVFGLYRLSKRFPKGAKPRHKYLLFQLSGDYDFPYSQMKDILLLDNPFRVLDRRDTAEPLAALAKLRRQVILATNKELDFPKGANIIRLKRDKKGTRVV